MKLTWYLGDEICHPILEHHFKNAFRAWFDHLLDYDHGIGDYQLEIDLSAI